jgi:hypothetical protein
MPVESTLLGAEGYTQNQRAIEEPWVRCFRTRAYGQTEFFLTDDDGYSHCFGVLTQR